MRKTYLLLAATLLLAILVACAPMEVEEKEAAPEKEEVPKEKEVVAEKVVEPKPTPAPAPAPTPKEPEKEVAPAKELPEAIKALIEKANTKLTSMVYLYASPESQGRFLDTYHVRGDKIKVKLYEDNEYVEEGYFDTVYLDASLKTATGRCENQRRCMSSRVDNTDKVFTANYDDYRRETPYEWLQKIKTNAEVVGPEIVDKRSAKKIKYTDGSKTVEMWLDESYGIPLQLRIIQPNEEAKMYQFSNFQFNTLTEADTVPAFT